MRIRAYLLGIILAAGLLVGLCYFWWEQNRAAPSPIIQGKPGYDVIVVGGEPEGVAAALSAARNGLKTLLIEEDGALGGLMTLGQLNFIDMNHGPDKELLTRGIFAEFYNDLGNAFDIERAKAYFLNKIKQEKNITLLLNTEPVEPLLEQNKVIGVKVRNNGNLEEHYGLRMIDATVDADMAVLAGVPYTLGGEDYGERGLLMGVTLVFEVSGVDWEQVAQYLKDDNDPNTGSTRVAAWGFGKEAQEYKPQDEMMRFRGPNMARQKNGNILINALLIFGVDGLDPASKAQGIERGKQEIPHIIEFMQNKFPGFANARYAGTAEELYVRETRHIQGEYRLTITDVLENRDHWDRIGHGSYPVDVQPTGPNNFGNVIGRPDIYSIPFRCLVPLKIDHLLVAGRSASYDSLAHGSARVIPVGMVAGEAAGVASAYSIRQGLSFREMTHSVQAIQWVQNRLKKQKAYLTEDTPPRPGVMDHWAYPGVKVMRELGLIEGGYANDYGLERKANKWNIENKLNKVLRVAHDKNPGVVLRRVELPLTVTAKDLVTATAEGLSGKKLSFEEAQALLTENNILTTELSNHVEDWDQAPDFAGMLTILANLYSHLLNQ